MRRVPHLLLLVLLALPLHAALDTTDATQRLLGWLREQQYYGTNTKCLGTGTITYKNAGYTIQVLSTCANGRVLGVWRVDEHTGTLYRQNANGKFTPPGTAGASASPAGTTLTVTPSSSGTMRGFERYGIPRALTSASYHGSHTHQGGFLAYDSWEYPRGTSKDTIARHYQRAFTTAGWRAVDTKDDGEEQELSFVRLDGGGDYPTLSKTAMARAAIVRISGLSSVFVEVYYDETEAPGSEQEQVRRVLRSIGTSSSRSDAEITLRQSSVSASVLASIMRIIPVVDADTREVMTFDTWARRFAASGAGQDSAALLIRDPVGTTVRTLFDPSPENVAAAMGLELQRR